MNKAVILYRKSKFYPDPVICAIFPFDQHEMETHQRIDNWKSRFLKNFPEFKEAEFSEEVAEVVS